MQPFIHRLATLSRLTFYLAMLTVLIAQLNPLSIFADPLPESEIQALDNYPNWVANNGGDCSPEDGANPGGSTTLTGNDSEQKIFNYYVSKGLSAMDAAAIDGNYGQESGWNSHDPGGYLAQWGGSRLAALQALAQKDNLPVTDLGVQLDYSWLELTNGPGAAGDYTAVLAHLKAATSLSDAVNQFMGPDPDPQPGLPMEVSGGYENPGVPQFQNRLNYAKTALQLYGGSTGTSGTPPTTGETDCPVAASVDCTNPADTTGDLSPTRQTVVCLAEAELTLWKSQPNYNADYPAFTYAQTGFLKYSENVYEEWCADFVSWIYNQASDPLQTGGDWKISYVPTIQSMAESSTNFQWHPESSGYKPQPGDIAIHLNGESHTNIFISSSGGVSTYIGGDQSGVDEPDGTYGTKDPPSGSRVSIETGTGYYDNGISGYVSPD